MSACNVFTVEFLRQLLRHDYLGTIPRVVLWLWLVFKQHRLLARVRRALDYPAYRATKPVRKPRQLEASRFFILGSGDSVNDLTSQQFAVMDHQTSVGLNIWVAHNYVPNLYSFEGGSFPASDEEIHHRRFLSSRLLAHSISEKKPAVLQLVPKAPHDGSQLVELPPDVRSRSALVGRVNLPKSRSSAGLRRDLSIILRLLQLKIVPPDVFPDSGASALRMIFYGFQQGFQEIVLVGVDLNATPYFWCADGREREFAELRQLFPRPKSDTHDTLLTDNRPYSAKEFIVTLADVLRSKFGVNVWAGSPRSSLANKIGVFDWVGDGRAA